MICLAYKFFVLSNILSLINFFGFDTLTLSISLLSFDSSREYISNAREVDIFYSFTRLKKCSLILIYWGILFTSPSRLSLNAKLFSLICSLCKVNKFNYSYLSPLYAHSLNLLL